MLLPADVLSGLTCSLSVCLRVVGCFLGVDFGGLVVHQWILFDWRCSII